MMILRSTVEIQCSRYKVIHQEIHQLLWQDTQVRDVKVIWILIWLFRLRMHCQNLTCIWFRTTYEREPNHNWKDQTPCDLCCSHCHGKTDLSHRWANKSALLVCKDLSLSIKLSDQHLSTCISGCGLVVVTLMTCAWCSWWHRQNKWLFCGLGGRAEDQWFNPWLLQSACWMSPQGSATGVNVINSVLMNTWLLVW